MVRIGYGTRIGKAFGGMVFGLLMFLASFAVLYSNEGRVNKSEIAESAVEINAEENANAELEGQLVSVSGTVHSEETLGDGMYIVPGNYLAISSSVEMYSWVEKSNTTSKTNLGGSEDIETTYSYSSEWSSSPMSSSNFNQPAGHENPSMNIEATSERVQSAKIGIYELNFAQLSLAGYEPLNLNEDIVTGLSIDAGLETSTPAASGDTAVDSISSSVSAAIDNVDNDEVKTTISGKYIYQGAGTSSAPQIGDTRISYKVIPNDLDATIIGKLDNGKISTFRDGETDLYRMFLGSKEDALSQLDTEFSTALWGFRILGFILMWLGLSTLLAPLSTILDVIPMFGSMSRSVVGIITFVLSFILSIVTITISKIIHNVWIMIGGVLLVIALFFFMKRGKKGPITKIKA